LGIVSQKNILKAGDPEPVRKEHPFYIILLIRI
jgi:hypothetical protein